ncbi:hypothetical protein GG804_13000 [Sphingomonas histidinilytica]|uniref:hypothetical protein n=1 Tax=Rhizorhabdus histidinilytica TaxID=439228 RepID=UPI001ADA21BD|nr:hypothetical protein [Rhizorhabdus histidinilytica]MBO9377687.1 hypothetical protein [Rhizorhabdus histidinilytica]
MIQLTVAGSNRPALVDDDFAQLKAYRWRLDREGYVMRKSAGRRVYLHHVVLPGSRYPAFVRDHVNRDKMDNQRGNLRWLPAAHSPQNRDACPKNKTGFRGVRFDDQSGRYLATVQHNGKAVVRKWFDDPVAADAYLRARRPAILPASTF